MAKTRRKQSSRIIDYQNTFGSDHGQRVLNDLMNTHSIISTVFVKGDPLEMALREGERNVILRIIGILGIKQSRIMELIKEEDNE